MKIVEWAAAAVIQSAKEKAMDGLEEWAKGEVLSEMKRQCPVDQGTMRNSLGTEREDDKIILGGGGPAESYIYRQHQDASLNHPVGKSHFIVDPVEQLAGNAAKYVEKHLRKT